MKLDINALITAKILNGGGPSIEVEPLSVTSNNTYTAPEGKAYSPVTVNVSGAGITKIAEKEFTVSTTSNTATDVGYVPIDESYWTGDKILLVTIIDKAGKRNGYFYGSISTSGNVYAKNGETSGTVIFNGIIVGVTSSLKYNHTGNKNGVYAESLTKSNGLLIKSKYNSTYGTIDGTFKVTVYQLDIPFLA